MLAACLIAATMCVPPNRVWVDQYIGWGVDTPMSYNALILPDPEIDVLEVSMIGGHSCVMRGVPDIKYPTRVTDAGEADCMLRLLISHDGTLSVGSVECDNDVFEGLSLYSFEGVTMSVTDSQGRTCRSVEQGFMDYPVIFTLADD